MLKIHKFRFLLPAVLLFLSSVPVMASMPIDRSSKQAVAKAFMLALIDCDVEKYIELMPPAEKNMIDGEVREIWTSFVNRMVSPENAEKMRKNLDDPVFMQRMMSGVFNDMVVQIDGKWYVSYEAGLLKGKAAEKRMSRKLKKPAAPDLSSPEKLIESMFWAIAFNDRNMLWQIISPESQALLIIECNGRTNAINALWELITGEMKNASQIAYQALAEPEFFKLVAPEIIKAYKPIMVQVDGKWYLDASE